MDVFLSFLLGYAVGMINPSYIIGRIRGFDIRKRGSGNAGGSNALITMGKVIGLLCILFDLAKAALVTWGAARIFPECALSFPAAAVGVVLGHVFPPYMKFRGGKGFACLGGAILATADGPFSLMHPPSAVPATPAEAIFRKSRLVWFSCDIYSFLVTVTNTGQWSDVVKSGATYASHTAKLPACAESTAI